MGSAEEIRKKIFSSDTEEVTKILETLDENSKILARTYMSALADRQQFEKAKLGLGEGMAIKIDSKEQSGERALAAAQ